MGSYWFGKPQMLSYAYLLEGLLIDTGHPNIKKEFLAQLRSERIDKCVLTHHHEDHSGNAESIRKMSGAKIYGSPRCAEILKNPPKVSPIQYITWGQNKKVDILSMDLSESVTTANYSFKIVETPGHAEDMICLYEPNKGWLFSADNFVNKYINVFMDNEIFHLQIESLKTLIALDFDVLFCSHFPQFRNGKAHLMTKLAFLEEFYGRVKNEYQKGKTPGEILIDMNLKERYFIKYLSLGKLSQLNMVKSVVNSMNQS